MIFSLWFSVSQNSVCVTTKLAQITVERENGCLGLTLRGGGDFPLIVTNVRPHGPVYKVNRIKPGDRLLRVDNVSHSSSAFSKTNFFHVMLNESLTDFAYQQITIGSTTNIEMWSCIGTYKSNDRI